MNYEMESSLVFLHYNIPLSSFVCNEDTYFHYNLELREQNTVYYQLWLWVEKKIIVCKFKFKSGTLKVLYNIN